MAEPEETTNALLALVQVQDEDLRLDQLAYRRSHLAERAELEDLETKERSLAGEMGQLRDERDKLALAQSALEARVEEMATRRATIESHLRAADAASFRDQESMANELSALARRTHDLEDEELALMEQLEPVEVELGGLEERSASLRAQKEQVRAALEAAQGALDVEIEQVRGARDELARALEAGLLGEYEQLRARLGGIGAARLEHGTCSGCRLSLPATELDRIRHAAEGTVSHCEQCGRILVV